MRFFFLLTQLTAKSASRQKTEQEKSINFCGSVHLRFPEEKEKRQREKLTIDDFTRFVSFSS